MMVVNPNRDGKTEGEDGLLPFVLFHKKVLKPVDICPICDYTNKVAAGYRGRLWGLSSAGRASALQAEGHSWLEHAVHTRSVEGSSPPPATKKTEVAELPFFCAIEPAGGRRRRRVQAERRGAGRACTDPAAMREACGQLRKQADICRPTYIEAALPRDVRSAQDGRMCLHGSGRDIPK